MIVSQLLSNFFSRWLEALMLLIGVFTTTFCIGQEVNKANFILNNQLIEADNLNSYKRVGLTICTASLSNEFIQKTRGGEIEIESIYDIDPHLFFPNAPYQYISNKFDVNQSQTNHLQINNRVLNPSDGNRIFHSVHIIDALNASDVSHEVLGNLLEPFNGTLPPPEVAKRIYNDATFNQKNRYSKRYSGLDKLVVDSLNSCFNNNYILVIGVERVKYLPKAYAKRRRFINRVFNLASIGWIKMEEYDPQRVDWRVGVALSGQAFLYKIETSDATQNAIWEAYMDSDRSSFYDTDLGLTLVQQINFEVSASASDSNERSKRLDEIIQADLVSSVVRRMEGLESNFQVKRTVVESNPVKLEIGNKEGLKANERYLVYEGVSSGPGERYKIVGAVRALKPTANFGNDQGQEMTSKFMQYQGRDVKPGMVVRQFNELGFELELGPKMNLGIGGALPNVSFTYDISNAVNLPGLKLQGSLNSTTSSVKLDPFIGYLVKPDYLTDSDMVLFFAPRQEDINSTWNTGDVNITMSQGINFPLSKVGLVYDRPLSRLGGVRAKLGYTGYDFTAGEEGTIFLYESNTNWQRNYVSKLRTRGIEVGAEAFTFISPSVSLYGGLDKFIGRYWNLDENGIEVEKRPGNSATIFGTFGIRFAF
jgi:hypothetical protein